MTGLSMPNVTLNSNFCFIMSDNDEIDTEDWNPITFAIYNNDYDMI